MQPKGCVQVPEMVFEVESSFEGRSFPQLSSFMEAQLRRWVRQKHTLPSRKTRSASVATSCDILTSAAVYRYRPFFSKPQPQSQLTEVCLCASCKCVSLCLMQVCVCVPHASVCMCELSTALYP